jgi:twitching motility two-component system response regulator PilH
MSIRTVMVVDDSATDRHVLAGILAAGGYVAIPVASAEEAQTRIAAERPDAILMDIVMPGKNGFEATRELTRGPATHDIPVIVCTSKSQPTDRIWALRQGAREVLVKPIRHEDLLDALARLG